MGEPTPYNVGGIDIAAGSALTVQIPRACSWAGDRPPLRYRQDVLAAAIARGHPRLEALLRSASRGAGAGGRHTDTVGPTQYNLTLSIERAHSIAAYLRDDVDGWMEHYPGRTGSAHWAPSKTSTC